MGFFKAYDMRGTYGVDFDLGLVRRIGRALPQVVVGRRWLVGRDCRVTSADVCAALVSGLVEAGAEVDATDCLSLAEQAGSARAVNILLMGRLSRYFDIPAKKWEQAVRDCVPEKFRELNLKAFSLGRGIDG